MSLQTVPSHPTVPLPYPLLVDDRTGIVRSLEDAVVPDHFPSSFALTTARLADTSRFCRWSADPAGAGYGFADPDAVLGAALGEATERYCGNLVPDGLPSGSVEALRERGLAAVDPRSIALFSPDQYAQAGFPAVPMDGGLELEWAVGTDLLTGSETAVPASVVWPAYATPDGGSSWPLTNPVIQAGLAAGPTAAAAQAGALREIVERDAMTMCWYAGQGVVSVIPPSWLAAFCRGPRGALTTRFLRLPTDLVLAPGLPGAVAGQAAAGQTAEGQRMVVVAALVRDAVTGYLSLGTGVNADPIDAATKAYAEALQLQIVLADYDDPDGTLGGSARSPASPLKPWRSDRAYGTVYRADRRDVVDYACHLQLHLDPAVNDRFEHELDALTLAERPLTDPAPVGPGEAAPTVIGRDLQAVAVDLTTDDVRPLGLRVSRVVVPGTYSNAPLGLPFLGGDRMAAARAAPRGPLPTTPLPH